MKIGWVGLGKMGGNMVERLLADGHEIVVYDRDTDVARRSVSRGAIQATSLTELLEILPERKIVWLMVPAGPPVEATLTGLKNRLSKGDILIDGGNSHWKETQRRSEQLAQSGIHWVDCGTSGGVWGLKNGYCLMYGGPRNACDELEPILKSLAPENGYLYVGPSGSGHFTKMVHNGIEYGMMQAYAEGFELLQESPFGIDAAKVSKLWQNGSVVRSWLLDLAHLALKEDPQLAKISDYVEDSGEGRWTVEAAIDFRVPAPVITTALFSRFRSRQSESFAMKLVAALRNQFGGHSVKEK